MIELTAIVTVYKVEKFLNKCLKSIQGQSFADFKVLMVVGNNDTNCISICKKYEKGDSRFRTILAEPKGLSDARNVGLDEADTKYVTFIDGDDYIHKDMFKLLICGLKKSNCDIAVGNYIIDNERNIKKNKVNIDDGKYDSNEMLKFFLCGHDIQFVVAWGKIYKLSLFKKNNIRYPVGKLHEDNLTTYKLMYNAAHIYYCNSAMYIYVNRGDSLAHNKHLQGEQAIENGLYELEEYLSDRIALNSYVKSYKVSVKVSFLLKVAKCKDLESTKLYYKTVEELKEMQFIRNPHVRIRMKTLCLFVVTFPRILKKILERVA